MTALLGNNTVVGDGRSLSHSVSSSSTLTQDENGQYRDFSLEHMGSSEHLSNTETHGTSAGDEKSPDADIDTEGDLKSERGWLLFP